MARTLRFLDSMLTKLGVHRTWIQSLWWIEFLSTAAAIGIAGCVGEIDDGGAVEEPLASGEFQLGAGCVPTVRWGPDDTERHFIDLDASSTISGELTFTYTKGPEKAPGSVTQPFTVSPGLPLEVTLEAQAGIDLENVVVTAPPGVGVTLLGSLCTWLPGWLRPKKKTGADQYLCDVNVSMSGAACFKRTEICLTDPGPPATGYPYEYVWDEDCTVVVQEATIVTDCAKQCWDDIDQNRKAFLIARGPSWTSTCIQQADSLKTRWAGTTCHSVEPNVTFCTPTVRRGGAITCKKMESTPVTIHAS